MGELKKWREEKWVRITTSGDIAEHVVQVRTSLISDRCLPLAKARSMSKAERAATAKRKKKYGRKKQFVSNTKKVESQKNIQNVNYGNYQHIQLRQHY